MSEQRLDLSEYPEIDRGTCFDFPHSTAQDYMALRAEALRAQASEDAEKARADKAEERVRVLEDKLEFHGIPMPRGVGKETT